MMTPTCGSPTRWSLAAGSLDEELLAAGLGIVRTSRSIDQSLTSDSALPSKTSSTSDLPNTLGELERVRRALSDRRPLVTRHQVDHEVAVGRHGVEARALQEVRAEAAGQVLPHEPVERLRVARDRGRTSGCRP